MSEPTTHEKPLPPLLGRLVRLAARGLLALRRPRRGQRKVVFLLMQGWGMGGTIRAALNLAAHLAERNDVEIISVLRGRRSRPFFRFPEGVRVTVADDRRHRRTGLKGRVQESLSERPSALIDPADPTARSCSLWTDVLLLRRLWRARPDVIIGTRLALNALAGELAPPGAVAVGQEQMNLSAKGPKRRQAVRERYHALDALVVLTDRDARSYREVLPPSVRLERIPNTARQLEGGPSPLTSPVVLAAGRLTHQKGFDRLIGAYGPVAAAHPDWRLRICGDGPRRKPLQRQIAECGLRGSVRLVGRVAQIEREMVGASVFVLSSRYEGFPLVLLEAMSMGLAVVSFDCPTGPREIVEDGRTGVLVPDGDEQALTAAILGLIEDEERRRRLGEAALAAAAEYSVAAVGRRWDALLDEMRGSRNGSARSLVR